FSTMMLGGDLSWKNIALATAQGVFTSAVTWVGMGMPVAQASAAKARGEGNSPGSRAVSDDERSLEIWKDKHAGLVSSTTVDGIPVVGSRGCGPEANDALNAANDVLTKTDRGKSMAEALKHRVETHWVGK